LKWSKIVTTNKPKKLLAEPVLDDSPECIQLQSVVNRLDHPIWNMEEVVERAARLGSSAALQHQQKHQQQTAAVAAAAATAATYPSAENGHCHRQQRRWCSKSKRFAGTNAMLRAAMLLNTLWSNWARDKRAEGHVRAACAFSLQRCARFNRLRGACTDSA
jgi:hypothetical protein